MFVHTKVNALAVFFGRVSLQNRFIFIFVVPHFRAVSFKLAFYIELCTFWSRCFVVNDAISWQFIRIVFQSTDGFSSKCEFLLHVHKTYKNKYLIQMSLNQNISYNVCVCVLYLFLFQSRQFAIEQVFFFCSCFNWFVYTDFKVSLFLCYNVT